MFGWFVMQPKQYRYQESQPIYSELFGIGERPHEGQMNKTMQIY